MACAVLPAGILALTYLARTNRSRIGYHVSAQESGSTALSSAISQAESVNGYSTSIQAEPGVHLRPVARMAPASYRDAITEIPIYFTQGRVVSIDLTRLSDRQAARLVDFCSGYLIGASGWMFRAAEKVVVLTPTIRKIDDAS